MLDNILLILFVLILSAKLMGSLMAKIGLDSTLGELLTGIIFGTSALKLIDPARVEEFAIIGSVLILFIAGMKEENIEEIYKDKIALKMGLALLFITGAAMTVFFFFVPKMFGINFSFLQALIMGIAFSIIDVGVPAKVLISKGLINLPIGKITIRSAIINIIVGLLLFTLSSLLLSNSLLDVAGKFGGIILFMGLIVALIYFLSKISKFVMRLHMEEAEFSLAMILVLFLAYISESIGFSSVLGAFIAGQLIGRTPFAETRSFTDKIKSISFGLFIPLFFVWFGLGINLAEIWKNIVLGLLIFVLYVSIRFTIAYIFMKKNKLDMPALVSTSMLSVDVESLVILIVAIRLGIFGNDIPLSLFAPSVLLSTLLVVVLVAVFSPKKKANESEEGITD
jgi:Kef-type K+ transport system membrane component KefB